MLSGAPLHEEIMVKTAAAIWPDGPIGNPTEPYKPDIREWGTWVEQIIAAFLGNGGLVYTTRAALFADLAHSANSSAWVFGDPTAAYNGIYMKIGASGAGSWTLIAPLPYSFIVATDVGAGTPDAIQATSVIPVSSSALVVTNVFRANTGSPVTISFNGGSNLTIKSNDGSDIVPNGLPPILFGYVQGSTFRCINDVVSSAIVAAAQAQANAAAASAAAAAASAAGVNLPAVAPNRMLVDNPAGTARESKTFQQVAALLGLPSAAIKRLRASAVRNRVLWVGHGNALVGTAAISGGTSAAGRTFAHADVNRNCRQDGYLRRVSLNIFANGGDASNSFRVLVLRPNGASYTVVATSDAIPIGAGTGIKTYELTPAIGPIAMGEKLGIWMSGGTSATAWSIGANAGKATQFIAGLATGGETYTNNPDGDMCVFGLGSSPIIVTHGDSILAGHNGGNGHYFYSAAEALGPAGERDSDPIYQAINRAGINIAGLDYANYALGGSGWGDQVGLITSWTTFLALVPKIVVIHCGINDVFIGRTWAQVEADMYKTLNVLTGVERLFISEILPNNDATYGTDANAAKIRAFNANYATWCDRNGAILIPTHDIQAQTRASTGQLDDMKYSSDGTHLTKQGADILGQSIATSILNILV
jgi:lysophospholipase L1-like esterase